jgi:hypothetical protein
MEIGMEDPRSLETLLVARMVRFNAAVHGTVTGLVLGLIIFVATIWLIIKGGEVVGPHLALLGQFFIGYRVTLVGSLIGFAWGFAVGFALGFFVTSTYNWIAGFRERRAQGGH